MISLVYEGTIGPGTIPEYGKVDIEIKIPTSPIVQGMGQRFIAWTSHNDEVKQLPKGFQIVGSSEHCLTQIVESPVQKIWGIQFHAEVSHTPKGKYIYQNFVHIVKS